MLVCLAVVDRTNRKQYDSAQEQGKGTTEINRFL